MFDPYPELKEHFSGVNFSGVKGVVVNAGRGAQGMKVGTKMFAMFYKGDLLLTLPPARVEALLAAGHGLPVELGTGKMMKNRVLIPAAKKHLWIELCEEAVAAF